MSDDMRLLILTHLRAAMERKDWRAVERARDLCATDPDGGFYDRLLFAIACRSWRGVEAAYVALGGMGCGEPGKSPGDPSAARDGVCGGVVA